MDAVKEPEMAKPISILESVDSFVDAMCDPDYHKDCPDCSEDSDCDTKDEYNR